MQFPHQRKFQEKAFIKQKQVAKERRLKPKSALNLKKIITKLKMEEISLIIEQKAKGVENRDGGVQLRDQATVRKS